jgi:hypothetical protein
MNDRNPPNQTNEKGIEYVPSNSLSAEIANPSFKLTNDLPNCDEAVHPSNNDASNKATYIVG